MELTLDQALQKGIEAHKAGKVQEADRYYTAILKANPKHPDANHNMGVLAVGVGQVEAALPFFKAALDVKSNIAQYWLSYIDALIKLDRMVDAKAVLDQAKSEGAKGDGFDQIEKQLNTSSVEKKNNTQNKRQKAAPTQRNILDNLKLDKAMKLAKKKVKDGLSEEAKRIYQDILDKFPKNRRALDEIRKLAGTTLANTSDIGEPPNEQIQVLVNLHAKGQFQEALIRASQLRQKFPNSVNLYNIIGVTNKGLGKLNEAIKTYKKAILINPGFANAYYNLGNILSNLQRNEEAVFSYRGAISIKASSPNTLLNLGRSLSAAGDHLKALDTFREASRLDPGDPKIFNNLSVVFNKLGRYSEAVSNCEVAISLNSLYSEAYCNLGVNLAELANHRSAGKSYKKSIILRPEFKDAYWNFHGLCKKIEDAFSLLKKVNIIDARNFQMLSVTNIIRAIYHELDAEDQCTDANFKPDSFVRTYNWFLSLKERPTIYFNRWNLFDDMISISKKERPFYEYGVWTGTSFRYLMKSFDKGFGFDTFTGLPTDWHKQPEGSYSSSGVLPEIDGGEFIVGDFQVTLPKFFSIERPKASLINFDADLYSSTLLALRNSRHIIDEETILIFDEFIINTNWEQDEYKALNDFCEEFNLDYKVLAVSFFTKQVAVKVLDSH